MVTPASQQSGMGWPGQEGGGSLIPGLGVGGGGEMAPVYKVATSGVWAVKGFGPGRK